MKEQLVTNFNDVLKKRYWNNASFGNQPDAAM
jgi:hypothetical protein